MQRPNIIYIHSHDTGRYIQPYGYAVSTPNLQRFAEEGVLFRNAFCAGPTCSPSRAALLTGMCPHRNGMLGLSHHGGRLRDPSMHLANYLKSHGYATALSGTVHETGRSNEEVKALGYDRLVAREYWPKWAKTFESWNAYYAQAAADYILKADDSRPFFLSCGFDLTHRMGEGEQWHTTLNPPEGDSRYVKPPAPLPDTPETRRDFADFSVAVNRLDTCMGRVLDAIATAGIAENTWVFVTTDHGIAFPLMKCNLTVHGTGVMLMARGPGGFSGRKVVDALVSHIDIFPTICELTELPPPEAIEGVSLVPLVNGAETVRDAVFAEVNWHGVPEPMRTVRTERYAYIRRYAPRPKPGSNCDNSISKTLLRSAGWPERTHAPEELYDLIFDPNEACNRAGDPAYKTVLSKMRSRLQAWMVDTGDPVLTGRIDPPLGADSKKLDGISPDEWLPAEPIIIDTEHVDMG